MKHLIEPIIAIGILMLLVGLIITGCSTVGDGQNGMVFQTKDGTICGVMVTNPYEGEINPFTHVKENPGLYKIIKVRKCTGYW